MTTFLHDSPTNRTPYDGQAGAQYGAARTGQPSLADILRAALRRAGLFARVDYALDTDSEADALEVTPEPALYEGAYSALRALGWVDIVPNAVRMAVTITEAGGGVLRAAWVEVPIETITALAAE